MHKNEKFHEKKFPNFFFIFFTLKNVGKSEKELKFFWDEIFRMTPRINNYMVVKLCIYMHSNAYRCHK